jgi:hypothetical protein
MCEVEKVVGRTGPANRKANEPPQGAAVVDGEVVAVFIMDAKGVIPVRDIEGDEVVTRAGHVSQVFEGLACHGELGIVAVEFSDANYQPPLVVPSFGTRNMRDT